LPGQPWPWSGARTRSAIAAACCLAAALSVTGSAPLPRAAAHGRPGAPGRRSARTVAGGGQAGSTVPGGAAPSPAAGPPAAALPPPHTPPDCGAWTRAERAGAAETAFTEALAPVLRQQTGLLAVGVTDLSTGLTASYHPRQEFHTASIVKADILAALLLEAQQQHDGLDADEMDLATTMIENSDNDAATDLWEAAGATAGMAAADRALRLRYTVPGDDDYWGLTDTTVADQLHLLSDLTSPRSPLTGASRRYELTLMRDVEPGQSWGVTAAASPGTQPAVKNGWLPDADNYGLWDINSIGVVSHHGQRLLIAVLSSDQPSQQGGIDQVQAAAQATAAALTSQPCPQD
jgi:hypothetical protein